MSIPTSEYLARIAALNPVDDQSAVVDPQMRARTLDRVAALRERMPPQRRPVVLRPLGAVLLLGAVVAMIGLGLALRSDDNPAGLPAAAAALAERSAGRVLHTVQTGGGVPDAAGGPSEAKVETWALRDGSRARTKTTFADGTFQDLVIQHDGHRYRVDAYWSRDGRHERGGWRPLAASAPKQTDPATYVAEHFAQTVRAGRARVVGETSVDGTPAYRISPTGNRVARSVVWTIAKDPDHPRLFRQQICLTTNPCLTTTYSVFESTSDTATLSLPDYSGADRNP